MLTFQIFTDATASKQLLSIAYMHIARSGSLRIKTNRHGYASLEARIPHLSQEQLEAIYNWPGTPHVEVRDHAFELVWSGRVEDVMIDQDGAAELVCMGYARAMADLPYSAMWSTSDYSTWREVTRDEQTFVVVDRYKTSTENRLYMSLEGDASYSSLGQACALTYAVPPATDDQGLRAIARIDFDYDMRLPADWELRVYTGTDTLSLIDLEGTVVATGAVQSSSSSITSFTYDRPRFLFVIINNTGGTYSHTNESGYWYCTIDNVRVWTKYPGAGIYSSDIAEGLIEFVNGQNAGQLSDTVTFVETQSSDIVESTFEDELPFDILTELADAEDIEWGVWGQQALHLRARGSAGKTWYAELAQGISMQRTMEDRYNSAYATYKDGSRVARTAIADNELEQEKEVTIRRAVAASRSTDSTEAAAERDALLSAQDGKRRADLWVERVFLDGGYQELPPYLVRAGDTMTVRLLSPKGDALSASMRTFVLDETEFAPTDGALTVSPRDPLPKLFNPL